MVLLVQWPKAQEATKAGNSAPAVAAPPNLVRYRGLTFATYGEYSIVWDDEKIVRGIWYLDPCSINNPSRNRMVVATAKVNGFTVLDSDYATTIVGGVGGVENLQNPGGAVLWFDSTSEIFGK